MLKIKLAFNVSIGTVTASILGIFEGIDYTYCLE